MPMLKNFAKNIINRAGFDLVRIKSDATASNGYSPYSPLPSAWRNVVDLEILAQIGGTIPGMISRDSGQHIFTLCYFQNEQGDVVEIGSWQGRSASYLARATLESENGSFYAIDHFKGNPGKEHYYVLENDDLSDLKAGFENNIRRVGLSNAVHLLDMTNVQAAQTLKDKKIRFLLIDGDHTAEGVQKDIDLFFPLLTDGAIVVFDDYSKRFTGLIGVIDTVLSRHQHSRVMTYANTLVLKFKK